MISIPIDSCATPFSLANCVHIRLFSMNTPKKKRIIFIKYPENALNILIEMINSI